MTSRGRGWWIALALSLAVLAVYGNSFNAPFVFDDVPSIPENTTIRRLWPLSGPLSPPTEGQTVTGRPLLNLSFAINYAIGGTSVRGYHVVNLAIHLAAGLLLFGLVRRTLERPLFNATFGAAALPLAGAVAALWILHPLQTESVTYVVQRGEALMGLFLLLTLYACLRAIDATRPALWRGVAWTSCLLGMATKEVMVAAPLLALLHDRFFVAGSWRETWRARGKFHAALMSTWLLLAWLVIRAGSRGGSTGIETVASAPLFWITQFRALGKYLALSFWPHPLIFDYGDEWVRGIGDVLPHALVVIALAAGTVYAFVRGRPIAFLGLWFFAILAPTSVIPGDRQTMSEHRMYLPLAAVAVVFVLGLYRWLGRRGIGVALVTAIVLAVVAAQRNSIYGSVLSVWSDTVAKQPGNRWAHNNLGNTLVELGRPADALPHYETALRLTPSYAPAHYLATLHHNAGSALLQLNRPADAIAQFTEAIRIEPEYIEARNNLGDALLQAGRVDEAIEQYAFLKQLSPEGAEIRYNLGNALLRAGRVAEAVAELETAVRLKPAYAEAAYNLGMIFLQSGRLNDAITRFEQALRTKPDDAPAHDNLANAYAQLGQVDEAIKHIREVIRLAPTNAEAHNNLSLLYLHLGREGDALAELNETLRLNPNHAQAKENLARLQRSRP